MKKVSDLELGELVKDLIKKIDDYKFQPNFIVETGNSAHYLASKLGEYFSSDVIKFDGKRCNSENPFLSLGYSMARGFKRGLFKIFASSQDNYILNSLRNIVMKIYEKNYPTIKNNGYNESVLRNFNRRSKVLIADDNAFTGRTIDCVAAFLVSKGFEKENIKSCVISTTNGYKPDFYSLEEAVSFPWNPIGV